MRGQIKQRRKIHWSVSNFLHLPIFSTDQEVKRLRGQGNGQSRCWQRSHLSFKTTSSVWKDKNLVCSYKGTWGWKNKILESRKVQVSHPDTEHMFNHQNIYHCSCKWQEAKNYVKSDYKIEASFWQFSDAEKRNGV